jgi:hypothetical protein
MSANPNESSIETKMTVSNLKALGAGTNARRAGQPRSVNPWPFYRPEHKEWNEGWNFSHRHEFGGREP